jgi:hypothetical protein
MVGVRLGSSIIKDQHGDEPFQVAA